MKKLYFLVADLGDGTTTVRWFEDGTRARHIIDEDPEQYCTNEGGPRYITLPDDFDITTLGVHLSD